MNGLIRQVLHVSGLIRQVLHVRQSCTYVGPTLDEAVCTYVCKTCVAFLRMYVYYAKINTYTC